jgi:hypothetical protein
VSTHFLILKAIVIIGLFETITATVAIKPESRTPHHKRGNSRLEAGNTTHDGAA